LSNQSLDEGRVYHKLPRIDLRAVAAFFSEIRYLLKVADEEKRPWTAQDVAAYLGVTPKTVRNWVTRRQVPHIKLVSGAVRFMKVDIDKWMASQKVKVETLSR